MNMSSCCIICADNCDPQLVNSAAQWWQRLHPIVLPDDYINLPATATFCDKCNSGFEQLVILKEELERLEKELKTKVETLRRQVAGSQGRFVTRNLEDVRFRDKLMGDYACATIAYQPQIFQSMPNLVLVQQFQLQNEFNVYQIPNLSPVTVTIPQILQEEQSINSSNSNEEVDNNNDFSGDEDSDKNFEPGDNSTSAEEEEEEQNVKALIPPPKKGRRSPRKRSNTNNNQKKSRKPPENFFTPLIKMGENQFSFEGFEVVKLDTGCYKCVTCGWTEKTKGLKWMKDRTMKVHISGHHLDKYKCSECDTSFTSPVCLKKHNEWFHPDPTEAPPADQLTCSICEQKYRKNDQKRHMWSHKSKEDKKKLEAAGKAPPQRKNPSNCLFCKKFFNHPNNRQTHERICKENPNAGQENSKQYSEAHLQTIRRSREKSFLATKDQSAESSVKKPRPSRSGITRPTSPGRNTPCDVCGKVIKHKYYLPTHMWTHMNAQEKKELKANGEKLPASVKNWEKDCQCTICGVFVAQSYILKHIQIHEKPEQRKKFSCDFAGCKSSFFSTQSLKHHKVKVHKQDYDSWFKCPAPGCSKKFLQKFKLTKHCVASHRDFDSTAKFFKCDMCDAQFTLSVHYNYHVKEHTKKNQTKEMFIFECARCLQKFVTKNLLKAHLTRKHQNNQGKKKNETIKYTKHTKFTCHICLRPVTARSLEDHLTWLHKNIEEMCTTLNAGTKMPSTLSSEKRKECGQAFLSKETHQVDIKCLLCKDEEDFDRIIDLSEHISKKHPDLGKQICEKKMPTIVLDPLKTEQSKDGLEVLSISGKVVARVGKDGKMQFVN